MSEAKAAGGAAPPAGHAAPSWGRLAAGSRPGRLLVALGGQVLPALTTLRLDEATIAQAVASGQAAVLLFENDDHRRPIVVGLVQPVTDTPLLDEMLGAPAPPAVELELERPAQALPAVVDGKRIVIDAKDELVLRCGRATITLRRNGKVVIRGTYVETHADGTNRIKGGSVKIN
jgi:hypothetical protein